MCVVAGGKTESLDSVTHDEITISFYDGLKSFWFFIGEKPFGRKRQEQSINFSDFLSDVGGRLTLEDDKSCSHPTFPLKLACLRNRKPNMMVNERLKTY